MLDTSQRALRKYPTFSAKIYSEPHQWSRGYLGATKLMWIRRVVSHLSRCAPRPPFGLGLYSMRWDCCKFEGFFSRKAEFTEGFNCTFVEIVPATPIRIVCSVTLLLRCIPSEGLCARLAM
eukprot:scaffold738_cov16-Tisochrysis_lutea.AAC.1